MRRQKKTVLVVEDSPVQMLSMSDLLQKKGLNVLCAHDGRIGLALALQHRPDAIVLDIEMPGKNGLEVCAALKDNRRTADIPVIMLTAHHEMPTIQCSFDFGAIDYIPKDVFSSTVLVETLRQLRILPEEDMIRSEARHAWSRVRVVVVDDSPTMREMLTTLLQSALDIDVVGEDAVLKKPSLDDPEMCENVVNTMRLMACASVIHLKQGLVRHD